MAEASFLEGDSNDRVAIVWRRFQEGGRIDGDAVKPQLEVDVFTGRQTGFTHEAEACADLNDVGRADAHGTAFEMEIAGLESVFVIENDIVAAWTFSRKAGNAVDCFQDDTGKRSDDGTFSEGRTGPDGSVHAVVGDSFTGYGMDSHAEGRRFHEIARAFEDAALGESVGNSTFGELFGESARDVHSENRGG